LMFDPAPVEFMSSTSIFLGNMTQATLCRQVPIGRRSLASDGPTPVHLVTRQRKYPRTRGTTPSHLWRMLKAERGHDLIQKITPANESTHPLSAHRRPAQALPFSSPGARLTGCITVADAEDTQLQKLEPPFRLIVTEAPVSVLTRLGTRPAAKSAERELRLALSR
jgi:hypothetical protein